MEDNELDINGEEEQQTKVSYDAFIAARNRLEQSKYRYRKLKRSKGWAVFCCVCLLVVIAGISGGIFSFFRTEYADKLYTQRLNYSQQYLQWRSRTFADYYDGCLKEKLNSAILSNDNQEELNAYIAALKRAKLGLDVVTLGPVSCFTSTMGHELSEYIIAGNDNTVIFPGAVLKGDSLFKGSTDYTLLPLERTSMFLTSNQSGGYSAQVENVDYRNVSKVLEKCAEKNEGQKAKEWKYYMQVIKSAEELEASLGVKLPVNQAGIEFGSTNSEEFSSVAVIYSQTFYTVSAEPKKNAVEYFQNGVDPSAFGDYEPAYVSSVDYGRMVVVLIQGNMSAEELGAKVSACIKGVSIETGLANIRTDTSLTSNIFQYGGEQKDVGMIMDTSQKTSSFVEKWNEFWHGSENRDTVENRINDFICTDAPATNPVPIAYSLKYLTDNSYVPAMVISSQESMLANRDTVKKVTITTDVPVIWENASEVICISVSSDYTAYELIWDSDYMGILQGKAEGVDVQLVLGDCLPNGKSNVVIGKVLWFDITADVTVSCY